MTGGKGRLLRRPEASGLLAMTIGFCEVSFVNQHLTLLTLTRLQHFILQRLQMFAHKFAAFLISEAAVFKFVACAGY